VTPPSPRQLLGSEALVRDAGGLTPDHSARADRALIQRIDSALEVLHGRWKICLLFLMARGIHRHSRLLDGLPGASKKVMTDTLRALERDGLVTRRVLAEVPARVEYSLTPLGWSMTEPLMALSEWGNAHAAEIAQARSRYNLDYSTRKVDRPPDARDPSAA
jgi:DNA-binding HxlR family transcriptional regulator